MKKDLLINLRVNKEIKETFQSIVETEGFSMSEVLEASMRDIVKKGYVPINIRSKISPRRSQVITIPFIKNCIEEAVAKCNAEKIRSISLFGSYSKGSASASSDVDLFLDLDEGFSLFDLADLQMKLEKSLGKKVDLVTRADDEYFMRHIKKERIKLYERSA